MSNNLFGYSSNFFCIWQAFEKGDDDFQVDDIFMSRASKKQSEAQAEEKDRSMAIYGL